MNMQPTADRHRIEIVQLPDSTNGLFRDGARLRVQMSKDIICIGCTDITPEAAKYIMRKYSEHFDAPQPTHVEI